MKTNFLNIAMLLIVALMISSCEKEPESTTASFNLAIDGLEDLGSAAVYEGWIIVDGSPVTTGIFSVDADGNLSKSSFSVDKDDLSNASTFVLTIEPSPDNDPAPSSVHILAGDFSGDNASLTIDHDAALATDLSSSAGNYILATPTDGSDNNEKSGIWFLDISSGAPAQGLTLDALPAGWIYEGWVVIDGSPVSTGTFRDIADADNAAPFSGTEAGPPFPGEDFLNNAPAGLSFPTDLAGGTAVISIEPVPDNSAAPFTLKPLVSPIAADVLDHVTYTMGQNLSFPTGTVVR